MDRGWGCLIHRGFKSLKPARYSIIFCNFTNVSQELWAFLFPFLVNGLFKNSISGEFFVIWLNLCSYLEYVIPLGAQNHDTLVKMVMLHCWRGVEDGQRRLHFGLESIVGSAVVQIMTKAGHQKPKYLKKTTISKYLLGFWLVCIVPINRLCCDNGLYIFFFKFEHSYFHVPAILWYIDGKIIQYQK